MQDVQAQARARADVRARARFVGASALVLALNWAASPASAVVVTGKFRGEILGYDVDRNGTEGVLSENAPDGSIATETFDQITGKILKLVAKKRNSIDNMITLGVVGSGVGLFETAFCCKNGFVKKRSYGIIDPLSGNRETGAWTPGLKHDDIILSVSENQGSDTTAVLAFADKGQQPTFVFTSNVAANTSSSFVKIPDGVFWSGTEPVMAFDDKSQTVVLSSDLGCPTCTPEVGLVNMERGTFKEFTGVGHGGTVLGIAVDPADGIALTTTEQDAGLEFYDLKSETGTEVTMHGSGGDGHYDGTDVEFDPVNKLFLVAEPASTTGNGSGVQVYKPDGTFVESIDGLDIQASLENHRLAINPATRTGFVLNGQEFAQTELQSFSY